MLACEDDSNRVALWENWAFVKDYLLGSCPCVRYFSIRWQLRAQFHSSRYGANPAEMQTSFKRDISPSFAFIAGHGSTGTQRGTANIGQGKSI